MMNRIGSYGLLAAWFFALTLSAGASAQPAPGKDYQLISPVQPTASGPKIEVIEFFSYGCPHCGTLQPGLHAWLKKKPADVDFQRFPVVFQDQWIPLAKAYYTFDVMGLMDKVHYAFFRAIHDERTLDVRNLLRDPNPLYDWVAKQGVDRQKFIEVYKSFGVATQANRSIERPANYQVTSTPTVVVNGKYLVTPAMAGSYERFFQVLDQVIAMARKERAARK